MTPLERQKNMLASKKENEIWLYSYADLITNLMAFFLMLLAISHSDPTAVQKIKQSIQKMTQKGGNRVVDPDEKFATYVAETLNQKGLLNNVALDKKKDGVDLVFSGGILFDTSSAQLTDSAKEMLNQLAPIFLQMPGQYAVDVEGHSDARPIKNSPLFPSNWELSAARAGAVVRHLVSVGVSPNRMRAVGYAETRPDGKDLQLNRRVVISISRRSP